MIISKQDKIEKLNMSRRANNALNEYGILTISNFMEFPENEFINMHNIGKKTYGELMDCLASIKTGKIEISEQDTIQNNKCFVHTDGKKYKDIAISELGLSVRSYNCLVKTGYNWLSEIITLEEDELKSISGMGAGSVINISEVLSAYRLVSMKEENNCSTPDLLCNLIFNSIVEKMELNGTEHYNAMIDACSLFLENKPAETITGEILSDSDLLIYIQSSYYLENEYKNYLYKIISNHMYGCGFEEIFNNTPIVLQSRNYVNKVLNKLIDENKIKEVEENIFVPILISFVEGSEKFLTDKEYEIFIKRTENYTLEEIGIKMSLTRERVRQIEKKAIKKLNDFNCIFKEDFFYDIFTRYCISAEDFNIAFKNSQTYAYLSIRYSGKKVSKVQNKLPLNELLNDPIIPKRIKKATEKAVYKNHVKIASEYVLCSRPEITNYILRTYATHDISYDEFKDLYFAILSDIGESDNEKLSVMDTGYQNKLAMSNMVLWKYKKKLRYYNMNSYNYNKLFDILNLEQYSNVEYSTKKFFDLYPELMDEYDIRDEYELHNLLKKQYSNPADIVFGRMPNIEFGTIDRSGQVLNLLLALAPVTKTDLAIAYENEYGVTALTVLASYLKDFDIYLHDGIYKIDVPIFPEEIAMQLKLKLKDDFYLIEEVKNIYKKEFPNAELSFINPAAIKSLGFKVYSSYVVSNRFTSASEYMTSLLMNSDIVDIKLIPDKIRQQLQFTSQLYKLKANYSIVEFLPNKYISGKKLAENGILNSEILSFNRSVVEFAGQGQYFTIHLLKKQGFTHEFDMYGFNDWFYSSLLTEYKEKIVYQRVGGNKLFIQGQDRVVFDDFIENIVYEQESLSIDIYDLKKLLFVDYGLNLSIYKLIETTKNTSMFYDAISEKIFADYDTYYEEI